MGPWMDALVDVEVAKGRMLVKMLKGVLTAIIVAAITVVLFAPVTFAVLTHAFPNATHWDIWQNFATDGVTFVDVAAMETLYLVGLMVLGLLVKGGAMLTRAVWESLD